MVKDRWSLPHGRLQPVPTKMDVCEGCSAKDFAPSSTSVGELGGAVEAHDPPPPPPYSRGPMDTLIALCEEIAPFCFTTNKAKVMMTRTGDSYKAELIIPAEDPTQYAEQLTQAAAAAPEAAVRLLLVDLRARAQYRGREFSAVLQRISKALGESRPARAHSEED